MLQPKRTKFRKQHKGRIHGTATSGADLTFEHIIAFLRAEKASVLQLPERIEFVDQIPYTGAQKIDKKSLRADIEKKLGNA